MPGAFLSDEDDEDRREFGAEEEEVDDGCGGAVFPVGGHNRWLGGWG
jgi:hypothetical protein